MWRVGEGASHEKKSKGVTDPGGETAMEKQNGIIEVLKEGQSKWRWADQSFKQAENLERSESWFSKI